MTVASCFSFLAVFVTTNFGIDLSLGAEAFVFYPGVKVDEHRNRISNVT